MKTKFEFLANITVNKLILLTALFWSLFANNSFYGALLHDYPTSETDWGFLAAVIFGAFSLIVFLLCLVCTRATIKPILIFLLFACAFVTYFMDTYNVMINVDVVRNTLMTDSREINDLMSVKLLAHLLLLGALPALFVWKLQLVRQSFKQALLGKLKLVSLLLAINLVIFFYYGAAFASFFREHKSIRYYANPASYIYAITKVAVRSFATVGGEVKVIGEDAKLASDAKKTLTIFVVGETVRNDRFSLNGYKRETNPLLAEQKVVSFANVTSCGTSTNVSLPCMFSNLGEGQYDAGVASHTENALDVLKHAGVAVLWRDNNSSSKGVGDRIDYVDYREEKLNKICDHGECRDVGMLGDLQPYIDSKQGSIFIVLHQMGNHGPAYFKRYPDKFEHFKPTCKTNDLNECSTDEINNAYDNAVLYTDYFLDEVIKFLRNNEQKFDEVAMIYVGDHGESLGESGLYLHGVPNFIAPKEQRMVPLIMWLGDDEAATDKINQLQQKRATTLNHDYVFHTILGIMQVETKLYNPKFDLMKLVVEN